MPSHTTAERAKKSRAKKSSDKTRAKKNPFANITKGGLRKNLRKKFDVKLPAGTNIPKKLINKAANLPATSAKNKLIKKEAVLAKNFAKFKRKKK